MQPRTGTRSATGVRPRILPTARLLSALLALSSAACQATWAPDLQTAEPPPLRIALKGDVTSLDPHAQADGMTQSVLGNIYEGLTSLDHQLRVQPALAESWVSPDELTWLFRVREHVTFHDGRPLGVADVAFSFERALSHPQSMRAGYSSMIDAVSIVDERTLKVTTKRSYPILPTKLVFVAILPQGTPERLEQPVGTGPFRFVSRSAGKHLELEAFSDYWRSPASISRVRYEVVSSEEEAARLLLAGELDIVRRMGSAASHRVEAAPSTRVETIGGSEVALLYLNTRQRPLSDRRVRRALSMSFDRQALVDRILLGHGSPASQPVSRNVFGFAPDLEPARQDLAMAAKLLAEAGHPGGLELEVLTRTDSDVDELRRQAEEAGFTLRPVFMPWPALLKRFMTGRAQVFFGSLNCPTGDASDVLDSIVHSRGEGFGALNAFDYRNPELDSCIEGASTPRVRTRREQLQKCLHLLAEDHAMIPLYVSDTLVGVRSDLVWRPRVDGMVYAYGVGEGGTF